MKIPSLVMLHPTSYTHHVQRKHGPNLFQSHSVQTGKVPDFREKFPDFGEEKILEFSAAFKTFSIPSFQQFHENRKT